MLRNYIKTAYRNIVRHKLYSFICISGLSIGTACCILLFLFIQFELSYDTFHAHAERIYRVAVEFNRDDGTDLYARTQAPFAPALLSEYPEVEEAVRVSTTLPGGGEYLATYGQNQFWEDRFLLADPGFFKMFSFSLITGDPGTALDNPNSVILTEKTAVKYFDDENPLGKLINLQKPGGLNTDFEVTGVLKDIPDNSQLRFDFLFPFAIQRGNLGWGNWNYTTYIMLSGQSSKDDFEQKLPAFAGKYLGDEKAAQSKYFLQSLTDIHLHSQLRNDLTTNRNITTIYFLALIALIILAVSCINYMNLMTVRSLSRSKEIGIRKVVGASRFTLIKQFLEESILYTAISIIIALVLVKIFLPVFNDLAGEELKLSFTGNYMLYIGLICITLFVGFTAGSYPSFFISSFKPAAIFGNMSGTNRPGRTRGLNKVFVVFQFTVSIIFIIAALMINGQLEFIRNKNLGYQKENLIIVPFHDRATQTNIDLLKTEFLRNPDILGVTATSYIPSDQGYYQSSWWEGMPADDQNMLHWIGVDHDFLETFGIELADGRDFSKEIASDTYTAYILNEAAALEIGWDDPLGKQFRIVEPGVVIGIIKDFHFKSLHNPIEPIALYLYPDVYKYLYVRISPDNISGSIDYMSTKWRELVADIPFNYSFLDEDFDRIYKTDSRLGAVFGYVTGLAFLIASLGLFGLVYYSTEQRKKEICIRKVLGATVPGIVGLIVHEILLLVVFANIAALPAAVYFINNWLENFAYRMDMDIRIFLITGILSLTIALITVSFQSVKAAFVNPADTLRHE
ncbi:ABC transporter permease [candidate division KSB1 bacterium]